MADFPSQLLHLPTSTTINTAGLYCIAGDLAAINNNAGAVGTWPSANRAIYVPVIVESYVTAYQMAFEVTTQSGNYDVGIYDEAGVQLVAKGSTTVPAVGLAAVDITDTPLTPGTYFLAMAVNTAVAAFWRQAIGLPSTQSIVGVQDQDAAFALPATATFSSPASQYVPSLAVAIRPTI